MTAMETAIQEEALQRYRPYLAYKDSGVEWLGKIPEHWQVKRLRFSVSMNPVASEVRCLTADTEVSFVPMEAIGEIGGLDLSQSKLLVNIGPGYTYFRDDDVVVAKITPCFENGKGALAAGLLNGVAFGTTELHVLRARQDVSLRYLFYVSQSHAFRRLGEAEMYGAGGQKRVPESFIKNLYHTLPNYKEQRAIATFLDRETARIDALVAKKRRLIELLQEQRTALITRVVTKGLDPSVPMTDSGVEWLGEIPEHWEVKKVKHFYRQAKRQDHPDLTVLSVYREYGVIEKSSRDDNSNRTPENLDAYQLVQPGDLVINKMKAWQGSLGVSRHTGITSPDYIVYRPIHNENAVYLHYLLRSKLMANVFLANSNGIRPNQWRLEPERFEDLPLIIPPIYEQDKIVAFLERETLQAQDLMERVASASDCLAELRTALISAAVTGKIDVREEIL